MKLVFKIGGAFLEKSQNNSWVNELITLQQLGHQITVVHGAGPYISKAFEERGLIPKFVGGQRVTGPNEVAIVEDVLTNQINRKLVDLFQENGAYAYGISGVDGKILQCSTLNPELGQVGQVDYVREKVFEGLTRGGIIILSPVGINREGNKKFNVNADVAAAAVAKATGSQLVFLTGEKGLLDSEGQVIPRVGTEKVKEMIADGSIQGGMIVKAEMIMDVLSKSDQVAILNGDLEGNITAYANQKEISGTIFIQ